MKKDFKIISRVVLAAVVFSVFTIMSYAKESEKLIFVSDPYEPYVMDEPNYKGYITEMVLEIFNNAGFDAEYRNVPFQRALVELESGNYTGLLAVSVGREGYVYPENAMGVFKNEFFVRNDSNWRWKDISSFESVIYGGILGYNMDSEFIDPYVAKFRDDSNRVQLVAGSSALQSNVLKLVHGRIDVIYANTLVVLHTANRLGVADRIKVADVDSASRDQQLFNSRGVSVAFHLSNPNAEKYIKILDEGIQKIKENGRFREILARYGLAEYFD